MMTMCDTTKSISFRLAASKDADRTRYSVRRMPTILKPDIRDPLRLNLGGMIAAKRRGQKVDSSRRPA